jgi:hypothetical protein
MTVINFTSSLVILIINSLLMTLVRVYISKLTEKPYVTPNETGWIRVKKDRMQNWSNTFYVRCCPKTWVISDRGREKPREYSLLPENPRVLKMPRPPDKSPDHTRFFKRPIGNLPHQWERMLSMHVPSHQWLRRWEISKNLTQLIY